MHAISSQHTCSYNNRSHDCFESEMNFLCIIWVSKRTVYYGPAALWYSTENYFQVQTIIGATECACCLVYS